MTGPTTRINIWALLWRTVRCSLADRPQFSGCYTSLALFLVNTILLVLSFHLISRSIDHGSQGSRRHGADPVVDHHAVHAVADGGDARDGAGQAVRRVPRARAVRLRREAGPLDRRAAAARRRGQPQHHLHGHRRPVPQEVPRRHLRRRVQGHQAHILHHDLCLLPLRPLPAPQHQLHLWRLPRGCCHVTEVPFQLPTSVL